MNRDSTENLAGQRFGKLTVIERAPDHITKAGVKHSAWVCKCDCGNTCTVQSYLLKCGRTRSCGCMMKESSKKHILHGLSKTRAYATWDTIKRENRAVCEEWKDIKTFANWYNENLPEEEAKICKLDESKPYSPENCYFKKVHKLTYNGKTLSYREWAEITGIKRETIKARDIYGWNVEDILTIKPVKGQKRKGTKDETCF